MMAAIHAARSGAEVTILEGTEKPGKKLLLTGSGRCNLTNLRQSANCYRGADRTFTETVQKAFTVEDTLRFFHGIGLLTCDRDGYVYPLSAQASSVLDVLLAELRRQKVKLKCREKAEEISKEKGRFIVRTAGWSYEADAVILAAGSKAAPDTGSDGSGYLLAKGHELIEPLPALVPLQIKETWIRKFAGVRMQAKAALFYGGRMREEESGELQWTEYGISGIPVLQLSRYAVRAQKEGQDVCVMLDLLPALDLKELTAYLQNRRAALTARHTASELLCGALPKKMIAPLMQRAGISPSAPADEAGEAALCALAGQIKQTELTVAGARSFAQAQACQGGIDCAQVDPHTLMSRKIPGLFFCGELLDVDGACGGYNLQWAWSSGYTAGRCAAENNWEDAL